jgi:hypothetical protein
VSHSDHPWKPLIEAVSGWEKIFSGPLDGIILLSYCTSVLVRQNSDTSRAEKENDMTRYINTPQENDQRETRVQMPKRMESPLFQGWGPKF